MNAVGLNPLALFQQLERDSLGDQLTDRNELPGETWRGFVFSVEDINLAVPFIGEFEIVPCKDLAPLPMSQSWVKGMTNIRGEIYTVVDFSEFIGKKPVRVTRGCNLFLLPDKRQKSALLIESRVSLQTFSSETPTTDNKNFHPGLTPYLSTVLDEGGQYRGVIDVLALSESDRFSNIGK